MGFVNMNSDYVANFVKFATDKLAAIEVGVSEALRQEYERDEGRDIDFDYVIKSCVISAYLNGLIDCYMTENANPSDEYATELRRYIVTLSNQLRESIKASGRKDRSNEQDPRCN